MKLDPAVTIGGRVEDEQHPPVAGRGLVFARLQKVIYLKDEQIRLLNFRSFGPS